MQILIADAFYYSIFFGNCWMLVRNDLRSQILLHDLYEWISYSLSNE